MRYTFSIAWRNLWRHPARSGLTAFGMSVAVVMVMWMVSYMEGMYGQIYDVLIDQKLGHVQIHHPDYPGRSLMHDTLADGDALLAAVEALPESVAATGRLTGFGLVGSEETSTGGKLVGIDVAREDAVTNLSSRIREGRLLTPGVFGEAVIGIKLAEELEVAVGGEVIAILQAADGSMANELYNVVGIVKTGNAMLDRGGVWVDLTALQETLALPNQLHEVLVLGSDMDLAPELSAAVEGVVSPDHLVRTWTETDPQTAQMAGFQTLSIGIMLFLFYGVAGLGILNTMLMAVFERTRELGLLQALGLKPGRIRSIVIAESAMLGLLATAVGGTLGFGMQYWMVNTGMDMSVNGEGIEYMGMTMDPVIKGSYDMPTTIFTLVFVFVVCVGASVWPAFRATRMNPVDAMRTV
jgi:putative ABC transport system permease protein